MVDESHPVRVSGLKLVALVFEPIRAKGALDDRDWDEQTGAYSLIVRWEYKVIYMPLKMVSKIR